MAKITGRVEISVNGDLLLNKAGAIARGIGLSGVPAFKRTEIMGDTGLHGFTEEPILAECEVKITDRDDINLDDLAQVKENGTIVYKAAGGSGKAYTMDSATNMLDMELTAGEGEVTVIFKGPYWTESVQ